MHMNAMPRTLRLALPLAAAFALNACGSAAEEETAFEADVTGEAADELIVTEPDPGAEIVEVPESEMMVEPMQDVDAGTMDAAQ